MNIKTKTFFITSVFISIIFSYVYFKFYIPNYNIGNFERVFIHSYLFIFSFLFSIYMLIRNFSHINKGNLKSRILILSVFVLLGCVLFTLLPRYLKTPYEFSKITLSPEKKNPNSLGSEVWLNDIYIDGKKVAINLINLSEGWSIKEGSLFFNGEDGKDQYIYLPYKQELVLYFGAHTWSGSLKVKSDNDIAVLDLFSKSPRDIEYLHERDTNNNTILLILLAGTFIFGVVNLLYLLTSTIEKKMKRW